MMIEDCAWVKNFETYINGSYKKVENPPLFDINNLDNVNIDDFCHIIEFWKVYRPYPIEFYIYLLKLHKLKIIFNNCTTETSIHITNCILYYTNEITKFTNMVELINYLIDNNEIPLKLIYYNACLNKNLDIIKILPIEIIPIKELIMGIFQFISNNDTNIFKCLPNFDINLFCDDLFINGFCEKVNINMFIYLINNGLEITYNMVRYMIIYCRIDILKILLPKYDYGKFMCTLSKYLVGCFDNLKYILMDEKYLHKENIAIINYLLEEYLFKSGIYKDREDLFKNCLNRNKKQLIMNMVRKNYKK